MKIRLKKVTVITESLLKDQILDLLKKHGATGWTIAAVEGEGSRGNRTSDFEGRNAKIESLVSVETADAIMQQISEKFFADWSIIVYASEIEVMRGSKYLGSDSN